MYSIKLVSYPNPLFSFPHFRPRKPWKSGTFSMSFSTPRRRRRQVRRLHRHGPEGPTPVSFEPSNSDSGRVQLVIDLDQLKAKTRNSIERLFDSYESIFDVFMYTANEAFKDLQTLITVDPRTNRVLISCEDSTVRFLGGFMVWSFVGVVVIRVLFNLGSGLRRCWSRAEPSEGLIKRRDRSLGGREVVVGTTSTGTRSVGRKRYDDEVRELEGILGSMGGAPTRRVGRKLPGWWPATISTAPIMAAANGEVYQRAANSLIRAIMDDKMSGKDISEADILELRQICRKYGAKAFIQTTNTRDSVFRTAVDFIINSASRSRTPIIEIDGEDAQEFIAGLANNIGLTNIRAAAIVSGAVAARTRLWFLQSWALEMQGKHSEAVEELSKICVLHQLFPPEESSPEMEMVARGLEKHLKLEQREFLLKELVSLCNERGQRSAAEALGLVCRLNATDDQQEDRRG